MFFSVFAKDWYNFIHMLPIDYSEQDKSRVIKSHSANTNIFGLKSLLILRSKGILNYKILKIFKIYIKETISTNIINVYMLVFTPKIFIRFIFFTRNQFLRKRRL